MNKVKSESLLGNLTTYRVKRWKNSFQTNSKKKSQLDILKSDKTDF